MLAEIELVIKEMNESAYTFLEHILESYVSYIISFAETSWLLKILNVDPWIPRSNEMFGQCAVWTSVGQASMSLSNVYPRALWVSWGWGWVLWGR